MSTTLGRIVGVGLLFVLILLSGIWLNRSGKPYSTLIFTIHKLAGLAVGGWLGLIVYQTHQAAPLGLLEIAAVAVTVLFSVGTVATGGLLSIEKPMPGVVQILHQVLPALTVLSAAGTLYLLLRGN
jgi:uncharacterized membrane protein